MKIDVNQVIQEEIQRLNELFEKASKISKTEFHPFSIEDYTYLEESKSYFGSFELPTFLAYGIFKDVEHRINNPYPGTIWYWKKDIDKEKTKDFLPIQSKLMYDTLKAYMGLLKSENYLQALILFRSYIEYSSQFYACLLDYDFFQKYTSTDLIDEEYKKIWFNNLRPEKVLSKIKNMHNEIDTLLKEKKIAYAGAAVSRRKFSPFDSHLRGVLYKSLSGLAHGSYPALIKNDDTKLYALVFLCSSYMVESQAVIDEVSSVYFNYTPKELFTKWTTIGVYTKALEPSASLYDGKEND